MPALLWDFTATGADAVAAALREVDEAAEMPGASAEQIKALEGVAEVMKTTLDEATAEALASAAYKSKTGALDASTYAEVPVIDADSVTVTWGAHAEHASFVEKKGFSRTAEVAALAEQRLDDALNQVGS
jgi:hypothetical protein